MKARSFGLRVLSVALALTAVFAAREAFPMAAKTLGPQLPAEPDVAFLTPSTETGDPPGNSAPSANTNTITTNSIQTASSSPAARSTAAVKSAAIRPAVSRWSAFVRIWNAWAAFITHR